MRYRKLTSTGDYSFGNNQNDFYINSPQAIAQVIQTGLKLFLGEWYLDNSLGTPWFSGVLGKYSQSQADNTIQTAILGFTGVLNIEQFESTFDPATRKYSITNCLVNTQYGPTQVQIDNYRNF